MNIRAIRRAVSRDSGVAAMCSVTSSLAAPIPPSGEDEGRREDPLPPRPGGVHRVVQPVAAFAFERHLIGLVLGKRGVHQEAERAAGLEHRTVAGVLGQVRPLRLAAWPHADAGPAGVGVEGYFHGPWYLVLGA